MTVSQNGNPISDKGIFVDSKTGQVVEGVVEEGVQLVAPGGEITPNVKKTIDRAKADAGQVDEPDEDAPAPKRGK